MVQKFEAHLILSSLSFLSLVFLSLLIVCHYFFSKMSSWLALTLWGVHSAFMCSFSVWSGPVRCWLVCRCVPQWGVLPHPGLRAHPVSVALCRCPGPPLPATRPQTTLGLPMGCAGQEVCVCVCVCVCVGVRVKEAFGMSRSLNLITIT